MRILFVEDSESLRGSVRRALKHAGYAVDVAADGEEGMEAAEMNRYDVIVLDVMMPKLSGLEMLARLRAAGSAAPILLLTARDTVADRVRGLGAGADDYLIKPFAMEELLARVAALCRRGYGEKSGVLHIGPLELDLAAGRVRRDGENVELAAREWRLLEYLALRRGQLVRRTEIEEHIYDEFVAPMSNVVDAAVYALRRKIGPELIRTRRGLGYVLEAEAAL
ncbi:MAG: response regulator transcription factor [Chthoniobacteraceae bacterium]